MALLPVSDNHSGTDVRMTCCSQIGHLTDAGTSDQALKFSIYDTGFLYGRERSGSSVLKSHRYYRSLTFRINQKKKKTKDIESSL
jgi:hypothetical protein